MLYNSPVMVSTMISTCIRYTGIYLSLMYLLIKLCYLGNSIIQLVLMQNFLGFTDANNSFFGIVILYNILHGLDWQSTLVFPRVAYCYAPVKNFGIQVNIATAQCVLPTNMLNEKIYIFLWWWILLVCLLNAGSLLRWCIQFACQNHGSQFIIKYIKLSNNLTPNDIQYAEKFARKFLRHDGVFLLRMLVSNTGELITSEIINQMWLNYRANVVDVDVVRPQLETSQQPIQRTNHNNNNMLRSNIPLNISEAEWTRRRSNDPPSVVPTGNSYPMNALKTRSSVYGSNARENLQESIEMMNSPQKRSRV
ncbi:unnamed protein product [Trichobilharzia regenti]|nr:unnamed protein product [Trichobilharzia regenti]